MGYTIDRIQQEMRARGSHWWDADTMKFFATTVDPEVYEGPGGVYFVTKDKSGFGDAPKYWTVRGYDTERHDVRTVGSVADWGKRSLAHAEAAKLAMGDEGTVEVRSEKHHEVSVLDDFVRDMQKENPAVTERHCRTLITTASQYHRLCERQCNGYYSEGAEKTDKALEKVLRTRIRNWCRTFGFKAVYNGDPRGATVKLVLPSGKTNDWGSEGYCVPTSVNA
jgi:hypothetical protein